MSENVVSPAKYFLAGGFGGMGTVLVGHPFDTIKVRLQAMPTPGSGESPMYAGTWDCVRKTFQRDGFRGFYKGMAAPLVAVVPIFSLSFFGYGVGKRLQQRHPLQELTNTQIFAAGAFSGLFTTVVTAPGERVKALLQIQSGTGAKYKGSGHALVEIYKGGGVRSLYKGTIATLLRDMPGSGVYFVTYEVLQKVCRKQDGYSNWSKGAKLVWTMFCGAMAGAAMWIIVTPADVLKSRQQTAPEGSYNNLREVFTDLMRDSGPKGFYKGIIPVLVRALPANAACFLCFDIAMQFFNWQLPNL